MATISFFFQPNCQVCWFNYHDRWTAYKKKSFWWNRVRPQTYHFKVSICWSFFFVDIKSFFFFQNTFFQLILLMALAKGQSRMLCGPLTMHTQTAIHIARLLTKVGANVRVGAFIHHVKHLHVRTAEIRRLMRKHFLWINILFNWKDIIPDMLMKQTFLIFYFLRKELIICIRHIWQSYSGKQFCFCRII